MKDPLYKQVNKWRIFPRLFSIFYGLCFYWTFVWFTEINDPSAEQSAFAGVVVTAAAAFFKFYVESGKNDNSD